VPTIELTEAQYKRLCSRFGGRVRQKRQSFGMDQTSFAAFVGVLANNTISRWEAGANLPRAKRLVLVADRLGVSIDWLMGITEDERETADDLRVAR
jgi:transcriptional regulator with XRE-family HTH domain